jgi:hypothetical protein
MIHPGFPSPSRCGFLLASWVLAATLLLALPPVLSAQTFIFSSPPPPPAEAPQTIDATQDQPSHLSGPASFTISGTVISATTGTPLDRAELTLSTPGPNGSSVADAVTAENGSFHFDHLQAGSYRLQAFRRGYITAGYQEHEGFTTAIVTGPNLVTSGLRFELFPTAVIDGTITDDSGEPVAGAQVRLFRHDQNSGEDHIVTAGNEITDDTGAYEFARLRPGTYYLSISGSPWYAFHPQPKTDESGDLLPSDQQPHSPLDVAYSTTYYENGIDSDSATALPISAGDHVQADLALHAVPSIHIQIHLQPPVEGRGIAMPQLMQQVFNTDQYQQTDQMTVGNKSGGMVADLSGIAPGHYVLRQFGPRGEGNRTASVELTSDLSVDFAAIAGIGGVDVSGKIAMASGAGLPRRTRVSLQPADGNATREGELVAADGAFTIHNVPPGRYDVQIASPETRLAVLQMMASGAEARGNHITVASQPVLIAATLARGTTTLNGYAKRNGKGLGGIMIFLVPHDPARHDLYRRDQSSTDGSFTLNRIIPGDYTVVAIENGWTLDWGRPEVLAPYLARGLRVRVTGQKNLDLPSALEVEPR